METPHRPKGLLSFSEVKIFGWFAHTGHNRIQDPLYLMSDIDLDCIQCTHT